MPAGMTNCSASNWASWSSLGFDLSLTGFSELEVLALTSRGTPGLTDPDDIPEVPEAAGSVPGDLWLLGNHRLICGDSTNADDVERVLNGVKPHLLVTDPPYGVNTIPSWRAAPRDRIGGPGQGNRAQRRPLRLARGVGAVSRRRDLHLARRTSSAAFATSLEACGFNIRAQIIWDKTRLVIGRGDYHWQHEPAWYAVRKGKKGHWAGDRKQTTVWAIPHRKSPTGHGTEKPVECMKRPIENNSSPGQAVYEPFSGSGTTIIAAEMTGRCCHAVELNPAYVDLAITRWQDFTGNAAVHADTGATFADVRAQRAVEGHR